MENPTGRLFPGGYATVHTETSRRRPAPSASPPTHSSFAPKGRKSAWSATAASSSATTVAIGHDFGNIVEIVKGVTPADAVILDPPDSLAEGAVVRVENATAAKVEQVTQ